MYAVTDMLGLTSDKKAYQTTVYDPVSVVVSCALAKIHNAPSTIGSSQGHAIHQSPESRLDRAARTASGDSRELFGGPEPPCCHIYSVGATSHT